MAGVSISPASSLGEQLRQYSATFRAKIRHSVERGSPVVGCIRPQLGDHYGLRQFGSSATLNLHYHESSAFFRASDDLLALALLMKKDELLARGALVGLDVKKSVKKDGLVASMLADAGISRVL